MSTSIQNRTIEFQQCVNNYEKINRKQNKTRIQPPAQPPKKSQFSQQASIIAKDISNVTELLGKLAILAKRKPLFDDKPIEIGELTYVIKQDIFKIETNIQNLQKYIKGESSITIDSQTTQFSKNVLTLLNSKMKNISGEFKNVLEVRQKNEIMNKNRQDNFLSSVSNNRTLNSASPLNVEHNSNGTDKSLSNLNENPFLVQQQPQQQFKSTRNPEADPEIYSPYDNDQYLSLPNQQQQQMLLMEEQNSGQQYLQSRNRAVESIESTINEVGNLFQQLATMVSEQGEQIQRIDANVEDININISGAQRELLKYYAHITSNRWLFLKIFGVLIVFFFLWVLVS
ncbi:sed5 [Candida pseudojiufengensis]|uniref:sed5 n=1 Tax=Candida pseudojiufengensis TaxID=497109 RepID=UPI0022251614|nr:sed5 [Candida pseudojiufengensis]KAI5966496.1 sed5 [Candida pseudojiufengensis]